MYSETVISMDTHNDTIQLIFAGLKTNGYPTDVIETDTYPEWGIATEFKDNYHLLSNFLDKKWIKKVAKAEKKRDGDEGYPQLRMQYHKGSFYVHLECCSGKYYTGNKQVHEPKKFTESQMVTLLTWILSQRFHIYDQNGDDATQFH